MSHVIRDKIAESKKTLLVVTPDDSLAEVSDWEIICAGHVIEVKIEYITPLTWKTLFRKKYWYDEEIEDLKVIIGRINDRRFKSHYWEN